MTWTAAILRIDTVPPGLSVLAPPLRWPWRAPADVPR
jgi:3-oxoacyl-[acyl-carrier-protein] synthase-3